MSAIRKWNILQYRNVQPNLLGINPIVIIFFLIKQRHRWRLPPKLKKMLKVNNFGFVLMYAIVTYFWSNIKANVSYKPRFSHTAVSLGMWAAVAMSASIQGLNYSLHQRCLLELCLSDNARCYSFTPEVCGIFIFEKIKILPNSLTQLGW